ncbi:MAG: aminoglycoside phosphotransferase family protein, partial [Actinobacteria bacterium]
MPDETEELAGNVGGAVWVGDTVRGPTGPWTPAVHALLGHLAPRIPYVPAVLGMDER